MSWHSLVKVLVVQHNYFGGCKAIPESYKLFFKNALWLVRPHLRMNGEQSSILTALHALSLHDTVAWM